MDIERELEILIDKHKGKQVGLGEIRLDWFAEDCLKEIRRLKAAIAALQEYQPVAISKTETTSEPCDYCKNTDYLKRNLTFVDRYYEQNIEPKFCPNCGRQL
jgi:hypothetical protein